MGRHKNIKTPEKMWEYFQAYRKEVKSNPIKTVEQKKGNTIIPKGASARQISKLAKATIELPAQRPLTMEGFQNWLEDNDIITDVTDYFENKNGSYSDFLRVCQRVRRVIRQDQIEGGMAGIYNPSITQRLNGLADKQETKTEHSGDIKVTLNLQ
jgi:hypothetical protein